MPEHPVATYVCGRCGLVYTERTAPDDTTEGKAYRGTCPRCGTVVSPLAGKSPE